MLSPDVNEAEQALASFARVMNVINKYTFDLTAATFGPVQIEGSEVDLLAPYPVLKANIAAAQQHAWTFINLNAFFIVLIGVDSYNSTFQSKSGEILGTLGAASQNPNGQPTPAQQQSITSGLQSLLSALTEKQNIVQGLIPPATTFADQITTDHANLTSGENSISAGIANVEQWVQTESLKVMGGIDGCAFVQTVDDLGLQMTNGLKSFLGSIEGLVSQNETASDALSGVLTVWQTLVGKYADVISNLQQAGGDGILEAGDISSAQAAWSELDKYLATLA